MNGRGTVTIVLITITAQLTIASVSGGIPFTRVMYGSWNTSQIAAIGFDAYYKHGDWEWGKEWIEERFSRESLNAAANNLTFIAGQYYDSAEVDFEYVRAMNQYGDEEPRTASPLDETYWRKHVEEGAVFIANLSLHYPIWGIVWDMEPYRSTSKWPTDSYTYDRNSIYGFANETGRTFPELGPTERYMYLARNGLLEEYKEWQAEKVSVMAKRTAEKVHAINLNLSLGILWHQDAWLIWSVLSGFNSSCAPVTAWSEETYPGYEKTAIDNQKDIWVEYGLNGIILPGFYTVQIPPFGMIINMEEAIRWDGALWVYQYDGDPYRLADEESYARAYQLLQTRIFFNKSRSTPLPIFDIYPGCEARPYLGPEGVSVLLPYYLRFTLNNELVIQTDQAGLGYIGRNLSVKYLDKPIISPADLPCMLFDLNEADLVRTHTWSMIRELEDLTQTFADLGLGELTSAESASTLANEEFESGRYAEARDRLIVAREEAYGTVMDQIWPLYLDAMKSPRNSTIPLVALNSISSAQKEFLEGDLPEGRNYLFKGFRGWTTAVDENLSLASPAIILVLTLMLVVDCHRACRKR